MDLEPSRFQLFRLAGLGLVLVGALVYAVWIHFGWLAGIGAGAGLGAMIFLIFRQKRPDGNLLQDIRAKAAKRWTCKSCGTPAKPKSTCCLNCGTNF